MATNTASNVADAVVAELNDPARTWVGQFTAVRLWQPIVELEAMPVGDTFVTVVPDSMPVDEKLTRGLQHQEHLIYILVQAKLADRTNGAIDPLADLLEVLKDWFFSDQHPLATMASARCQAAAIETYCWRADLDELQAYTGVAALTFRVDA